MTYESLLSDLSSTYNYLSSVISSFISFLSDYPILMLGCIVIIVLPTIMFIFHFISDRSTDDFFDMQRFVIKKYELKQQKNASDKLKRESKIVADKFFENNPQRMSIRINGFTFYQDSFENKHWGNSKKTRVTKKYQVDSNGSLTHLKTSISSTETYDNTSAAQQETTLDAD